MGDSEVLLRFARLRDDLLPVPIVKPGGQPIAADWLAVSRTWTAFSGARATEAFVLYVLTDAGNISAQLEFETLEIAIDQAHAILGIESAEWRNCEVAVDGDAIPWSVVAGCMTESETDVRTRIQQLVEADLLSMAPHLRAWVQVHAVTPRLSRFRTLPENGDTVELWLVTDDAGSGDTSSRVVYDPGLGRFGIADRISADVDWYMGPIGTFSQAIDGM